MMGIKYAPERIWAAPNMGELNASGWAGVMDGTDKIFWESENSHHADDEDDVVEYVRADSREALLAALARLDAAQR